MRGRENYENLRERRRSPYRKSGGENGDQGKQEKKSKVLCWCKRLVIATVLLGLVLGLTLGFLPKSDVVTGAGDPIDIVVGPDGTLEMNHNGLKRPHHGTPNIGDIKPVSPHMYQAQRLEKQFRLPRYDMHLFTDKPVYHRGDIVRVTGISVGVFDFEPLRSNLMPEPDHVQLGTSLVLPSGSKLNILALRGNTTCNDKAAECVYTFATSFRIEDHYLGGEYKLETEGISDRGYAIAPSSRSFELRISSGTNPKIGMEINFGKNGYDVGDVVIVHMTNVRVMSTGLFASGAQARINARVGPTKLFSGECIVNEKGECTGKFTLPATLPRGMDGVVSVTVLHRTLLEMSAKTLPLLTDRVLLGMYPESGELVVGMKSRVYIEATSPRTREPVDFRGDIIELKSDGKKQVVSTVVTSHEGRGVSEFFTPNDASTYTIVNSKATDHTYQVPVSPKRQAEGVITFPNGVGVFEAGEAIEVRVQTVTKGYLELFKREKKLSSVDVSPEKNLYHLSVPPGTGGDGVLRVTLFHGERLGDGYPLAERLLFRKPSSRIDVNVRLLGYEDPLAPSPGSSVELEIETDIPATAAISVTDLSRSNLIEKRKRTPTLQTAVYLESEVSSLEDAEAYIEHKIKLDLLLGTQGWRRFLYRDIPLEKEFSNKDVSRWGKLKDEMTTYKLLGISRSPRNMFQRGGVEMAMAMAMPRAANMKAAFPLRGQVADEPENAMGGIHIEQDMALAEVGDRENANDDMRVKRVPQATEARRAREYAYSHRVASDSSRGDFEETLYWSCGLDVSTKNDKGRYTRKVKFDISDSLTTFRASVDVFGKGYFGHGSVDITSKKAVWVDVQLPYQMYEGDQVLVPITMSTLNGDSVNVEYSSHSLSGGNYRLDILPYTGDLLSDVQKLGNSSYSAKRQASAKPTRVYIPTHPVYVGDAENASTVVGEFVCSIRPEGVRFRPALSSKDSIKRSTQILPRGFPVNQANGGILNPSEDTSISFQTPDDVIHQAMTVTVTVFPNPLGQILDTVASLIRQPGGCFEQTSSTTYPMVLALRYLVSLPPSARVNKLITEAKKMLRDGYTRLVGFESASGGFEWFGKSPGHEALTAYGLVQFAEMSRPELQLNVVDQQMVKRTEDWLMSRRDGRGEFSLSSKSMDSFGRAPQNTSNAYIIWALVRAKLMGKGVLEKEISFLQKLVKKSPHDPYINALLVCVLMEVGGNEGSQQAEVLMETLGSIQDKTSGCVGERGSSYSTITSTMGKSKVVEATALAVIAWSYDSRMESEATLGIKCISANVQSGTYGSTQATALALQAIVVFSEIHLGRSGDGRFQVEINGEQPQTLAFSNKDLSPAKLVVKVDRKQPDLRAKLRLLDTKEDVRVPYMVNVDYFVEKPESHDDIPLSLAVSLSKKTVHEGDLVDLNVVLENTNSTEPVAMTIAKVGVPAGTEPRIEKLAEMKHAGKYAHFEVDGTYIVFYWRGLQALEKVELTVQLSSKTPGTYTSPASSAYVYYCNEKQRWVNGTTLSILALDPESVLR
uniref:Alpha-2-macroglobulin domain-containing protein n=1 Tax=Mucochytrium quahogii TaxID=96639 RepID=A0A7S2WDQ6_9STRA|mmetsp:Transcript_10610/g.19901  ORF Transcript_10610/g.19901 Transcript_10610/m.19901 type:complete len:1527 (-) Transcript_10610:2656-7236(-)